MGFWKNAHYFKAKCVSLPSFSLPCHPTREEFLSPSLLSSVGPEGVPPHNTVDLARLWGNWVQESFSRILLRGHPHSSSQCNGGGHPIYLLESSRLSRLSILYSVVVGFKNTVCTTGFWLILNVKFSNWKSSFPWRKLARERLPAHSTSGEWGSVWQHLKNWGGIFFDFMYPCMSKY